MKVQQRFKETFWPKLVTYRVWLQMQRKTILDIKDLKYFEEFKGIKKKYSFINHKKMIFVL